MKLSSMQPYLFPYIGYFQLIEAADVFVIGDSVQYIKNGWVNRNYYLTIRDGHAVKTRYSFSVSKSSHLKPFTKARFSEEFEAEKEKYKRFICNNYRRAPYFSQVYPLIEKIMCFQGSELVAFIENSIRVLMGYMDIQTPVIRMSQLTGGEKYGSKMDKQDRVIALCRELGVDTYINSVGGTELYDKEYFRNQGIVLKFQKTNKISYRQFTEEFVESLSIIDVLMFSDKERVKTFLDDFVIV